MRGWESKSLRWWMRCCPLCARKTAWDLVSWAVDREHVFSLFLFWILVAYRHLILIPSLYRRLWLAGQYWPMRGRLLRRLSVNDLILSSLTVVMILFFNWKKLHDRRARLRLRGVLELIWLLEEVLTFTEGCESNAWGLLHGLLEKMLPLRSGRALFTLHQRDSWGTGDCIEILS